ncbi:hypothetical protein PHMEG_00031430 [Phytophthora megakarya]|uniref:Uncharacterized protein n=1 Tax=Phytophthora megakarya TaxID=4795 RepID=A0A225UY23_9STRA|nr:hypothetical protein PHMEG_00031430 [Phytophthora megakarya]
MPLDPRALRPHRQTRKDEVDDLDEDIDEEWVESSEETSSTSNSHVSYKKQHSSASCSTTQEGANDQDIVTIAPTLEHTRFNSWKELENYLQEDENVTFRFPCQKNNKATKQNRKIRASKYPDKTHLVPEEWVNYAKTYVRTHAGKYKSRGKDNRKRQQSRALQCDAKATWYLITTCCRVVDKREPEFVLCITASRLERNHRLTESTFDQYQHIRTALEPDVVPTVNELQKAGAKKTNIMKCFHETQFGKYKYYEPVPDVIMIQHDSDAEDSLDEPRAEYSVNM